MRSACLLRLGDSFNQGNRAVEYLGAFWGPIVRLNLPTIFEIKGEKMKQHLWNWKSFVMLAVVGLLSTSTFAQETTKRADPSGTWRFEYDLEGATVKDSLELQLGKEGALTGKYKGRSEKAVEIKSGKVDGDHVTVEMSIEFQGIPIEVKFDGKIKDDDITGLIIATANDGEMEFDWVAKRSVEAEDVVGTWNFEIDAVETVLEPILEIKVEGNELKGTYRDPDTGLETEMKNLRIENNSLKFTIEGDFQGNSLKADFSGRPYGSKISGTIDYDLSGQTGEIEFEGTRKVEEKKEEASEPGKTAPLVEKIEKPVE